MAELSTNIAANIARHEKYKVFLSTAHRDPNDEQSGTGDVDYTQAIADTLNTKEPGSAHYIRGLFKEEDIYQFIERHAHPACVLHVMVNAPRTGFAFTVEGLRQFKKSGGRLVVTAVEFDKHKYHESGDQYRRDTLQYLKLADQVIFLDELDKTAAINYQQASFKEDQVLSCKLLASQVIFVPPTIPPLVEVKPQGGDIILFGMIREGKGIAHIRKLATLLAKTKNPKMKSKKIWVVGTVQPHIKNRPLALLLADLYPAKTKEIFLPERGEYRTGAELTNLWKKYREADLKPALPIELCVDVPTKELASIFKRSTYAFLPMYRGATLRNSSISSAIAQGFVTYSHIDEITPAALKAGGAYHGSIILMQNETYETYADQVFADIEMRETEGTPRKNIETQAKAKKLLTSALSREVVVKKHNALYTALSSQDMKEDVETQQLAPAFMPSNTVRSLFYHWQQKTQTRRSHKLLERAQNFKVEAKGKENFKALLKRLKNLEGPLTQEMRALLSKEKKESGILCEREKKFARLLLTDVKSKWTFKHATSTESYDKIVKTGNLLASSDELNRINKTMKAANTSSVEGHTNNVFFTFAPGDTETVRFLDGCEKVISLDYYAMMAQGQITKAEGWWGSDHFYAYMTEQDGEPVKIYDCLYYVTYRKEEDTSARKSRFVKHCHFRQPNKDGKGYIEYIQRIEKGDEFFLHPQIHIAITLMTIEKLRLMGLSTWTQAMQETDLEKVQNIVQALYHPGVFEIHKPVKFSLNQPGVEVSTRQPNHKVSNEASNVISDLGPKAFSGKTDEVLKIFNTSLHSRGTFGLHLNLTVLGAAILGGHSTLVKALLDRGIDLSCTNYLFDDKYSLILELSPLLCAVLLANPSLIRNSTSTATKETDIKQNDEKAKQIIKLLLEEGAVFRKNPNIRRPYLLTVNDLEVVLGLIKPAPEIVYLLLEYAKHLKGKTWPLRVAVHYGHLDIVRQFLCQGADINADIDNTDNNVVKRLPFKAGSTALMIAIQNQGKDMIQELLNPKWKIDINQELSMRWLQGDGKVSVSDAQEGYTALMMSVEQGDIDIVKMLLDQKDFAVDLNHCSSYGHRAFSIAKGKHRLDIVAALEQYAREHGITIQTEMNAAHSCKIHTNIVFPIITGVFNGERFFATDREAMDDPSIPTVWESPLEMFKPEEYLKRINVVVNEELAIDDLQWQTLGEFSYTVPEDSVAYRFQMGIFELNAQAGLVHHKIHKNHLQVALISESQLKDSQFKIAEEFRLIFQYICDNQGRPFSTEQLACIHEKFRRKFELERQLIEVASKGDTAAITKFLDQKVGINEETAIYREEFFGEKKAAAEQDMYLSAIRAAVEGSHFACVEFLLDKGADCNKQLPVNASDVYMTHIIKNGPLSLFIKLYDRKSNFFKLDKAFFMSELLVKYGRLDLLKALFDKLNQDAVNVIGKQLIDEYVANVFTQAFNFYIAEKSKDPTKAQIQFLSTLEILAPYFGNAVDKLQRFVRLQLLAVLLTEGKIEWIRMLAQSLGALGDDEYLYELVGSFKALLDKDLKEALETLNALLLEDASYSGFTAIIRGLLEASYIGKIAAFLKDHSEDIVMSFKKACPQLDKLPALIKKGDLFTLESFFTAGINIHALIPLKSASTSASLALTSPLGLAATQALQDPKIWPVCVFLLNQGAKMIPECAEDLTRLIVQNKQIDLLFKILPECRSLSPWQPTSKLTVNLRHFIVEALQSDGSRTQFEALLNMHPNPDLCYARLWMIALNDNFAGLDSYNLAISNLESLERDRNFLFNYLMNTRKEDLKRIFLDPYGFPSYSPLTYYLHYISESNAQDKNSRQLITTMINQGADLDISNTGAESLGGILENMKKIQYVSIQTLAVFIEDLIKQPKPAAEAEKSNKFKAR